MAIDKDYLNNLEEQYGLPPGLLSAQMAAESGGDAKAVSPKGALGAFQFMPGTAKQYGIDPLDPQQAAEGAARMNADLLNKYNGDIVSTLAAYNWGQGNVDRKGVDRAPTETQNYIDKILSKMGSAGTTALSAIGNAIIPSANAAENPYENMSDEDLLKEAQKTGLLGKEPYGELTPKSQVISDINAENAPTESWIGSRPWSEEHIQAYDLSKEDPYSQMSDEELLKEAQKQGIKGREGETFLGMGPEAWKALGQSAQAGLEGLGDIYDLAALPFNLLGAKIPSASEQIRAASPFPNEQNIATDLTRGAASAIPWVVGGSALSSIGKPLAEAVGEALATPQLTAFATGDALRGLAERSGASPAMQMAAQIAGLVGGGGLGTIGAKGAQAIEKLAAPISDAAATKLSGIVSKAEANAVPKTSEDMIKIYKQIREKVTPGLSDTTPKSFMDDFLENIQKTFSKTEEGKATSGNDAVTDLISRWEKLKGKPISLEGAEEMDRGLNKLISKEYSIKGLTDTGRELQEIKYALRQAIDKSFAENTSNQALNESRKIWSQAMKLRDLEAIQDRALMTENPVTSIKSQLKTLLNNKKALRGYSKEEIDALRNAQKVGAMTGLIKFAGSGINKYIAAGFGGASGGLPGAVAAGAVTHGASEAAKAIATKMQLSKLTKAKNIVAKGK